jgi:hypothetical protein
VLGEQRVRGRIGAGAERRAGALEGEAVEPPLGVIERRIDPRELPSVTTSVPSRVSISDRRVSLVSRNASKAREKSSKAAATSSGEDLMS